jgi:hypothetical protein
MVGDMAAKVSDRRHVEQGDLCAVTRTTQWWQRPNLPMSGHARLELCRAIIRAWRHPARSMEP